MSVASDGAVRPQRRFHVDPYFAAGMGSVVLLALIYLSAVRQQGASEPGTLPSSLLAVGAHAPPPLVMGTPGAPVHVVEVMEYQCPACALAHRRNTPVLERLAAAGQVVFRAEDVPLPSHPNAIPAGVYAACVAQTSPARFWQFHAALFEHQDEWAERYATEPVLAGLAHGVGTDTAAVRACLNERGEQVAAGLRGRFRTFAAAGFTSIPVWTVNGRIVPWNGVESAIIAALPQRTRDR
jgi:protein-disulfide isomerase